MIELRNIRSGGTYEPPKVKPMNGAPWQQLSMFTTKPTDEHRYPRGYTPERMHRVDRLFPPVTVVEPSSGPGFYTKPTAEVTPHFAKDTGPGNQEVQETTERNANQVARRRMMDTVSRSSINTNDLSGIRRVAVAPAGRPGGPSRGAVGSYFAQSGNIAISAINHPMQENTLIHEIGHHVDNVADREEFARRGSVRGASPKLEGFAVGYAHAHTVERGPMENLAYDQFHSKTSFKKEFERASGQTVEQAQAQIEASRPKAAHGMPPWNPRAPRQLPLFGRNASVFDTETEKDFGQWGYGNYTTEREEPLDTIRMGGGAPAHPHDRLRAGVTPKNYDVGVTINETLKNTNSAIAHAYGEGQPELRTPKRGQGGGWPK